MSEVQEYVLAVAVAGLGGVIKWVGGRITGAMDRVADAMVANTKSNAELSTKIDGVANYIATTPRLGVVTKRAPTNTR